MTGTAPPVDDDLDRIMAVMALAFPPEFGEAWNRRQVADALVLPGVRYGLIAADGRLPPPPGQAAAGFFLARGLFDEEELLLFAITPAERRRGLGHQLLARFIEEARARGVRRVFLEMRKNNPAGHLYAAHGFVPVGFRSRYYRTLHGERLDAITQQLLLD